MKTIDINLIGEFAKTVKSSRIEIKKDTLDPKTRIVVIAFLLGTFLILATSFGIWLAAKNMCNRSEITLNKLKNELTELQQKEAELSAFASNLLEQKKIAKFKLKAKKQIDNLFIPWSTILSDIAQKVPKNVIVTDIKKNPGGLGANGLNILGLVSAKEKPLTAVSFLILNINEDKESLLTRAKIRKLDFDKEMNMYEFEIEAKLDKQKLGTSR